jgi:cell division GTPase FtsZ
MGPLSFEDFQSAMLGNALVGTAVGAGPGRARLALLQALNCPLLEGAALSEAKRVLVSITSALGALRSEEAKSIAELARAAVGHADLKFCTTTDPSYGDRLRVTVFVGKTSTE